MLVLNIENLIGFTISAIVTLLVSRRLLKVYFERKEKTVGLFAGFIFCRFFVFTGFLLAPLIFLVSQSLVWSSVALSFAFLAIFISLVFPTLLFTSFKFEKLKNYYTGLIILLGIVGVFFIIAGFTPSQYVSAAGITVASVPQLSAMIYVLAKVLGVLPLSILFLSQARSQDRRIKTKSLLIGLGLLWVVTTIFVPKLIAVAAPLYFVGMYVCIGDILMFAGVRYRVTA